MNAIKCRVESKMNEQFNSVMSPTTTSDLLNLHHNLNNVNNLDFINEINISNNITFDHNYSELTNNLTNTGITDDNSSDTESEVTCLKNLLLPHLQLIQQQNEQIIIQEKHIRSLQFQNAMLKQRLRRLEMRGDYVNNSNDKDTLHSENTHSDDDLFSQNNDDLINHEEASTCQEYSPEENCDTKDNISVLDIDLTEHNIKEDISDSEENTHPQSSNSPHQPLIVETEEEVVDGPYEDFEDEFEGGTYSEEEVVEDMGIKRDTHEYQSSDEATRHKDDPKNYKSRSLLARNQSPSLSSSAAKSREDLTKPVAETSPTKKMSSRPVSNENIQYQNENCDAEEISTPVLTAKSSENDNRRNRHRKSRGKRVRLASSTSLMSNSSESKKAKASCSTAGKPILTTEQMYYTQMNETSCNFGPLDDLEHLLDTGTTTTSNLEVPSWRKKVFTSCYSMEGTENLDDDVFNKRHQRLEINERRRKKWDVQRIREQRHIEKLKQRQERIGSGARTDDHITNDETPESLWPSLDNIKFIEITENLPVAAFGCSVAQLAPSEFSLPWLHSNSDSNNSNNAPGATSIHSTKKSTRKSSSSSRRRGSRR